MSSQKIFAILIKSWFPNTCLHMVFDIHFDTPNFFAGSTELDSASELWVYQPSVQFSRSVVSESLWPHGLQHASLPRPSPTPGASSNSCPSKSCPIISSSVVSFSSHLQSFPASGSFPVSQLLASGDRSIGASASASVLPMNIQGRFPLGGTDWISCSPRDSQESSPTLQFKSINSSVLSFLYSPTLTSIYNYWKSHSFE